jgi:NAD(P)-dependent dehydrogenase (short-subunit alcohol dehydrogenase family)
MHTSPRLLDRVAIVTSCGRGIGKAVALAYAHKGADVAAVARTSPEISQTFSRRDPLF